MPLGTCVWGGDVNQGRVLVMELEGSVFFCGEVMFQNIAIKLFVSDC